MRVGVIQMTSTENVSANIKSALAALEKLRKKKCDIITLPENALYLAINKTKLQTAPHFSLKEIFWRKFQKFADKENCVIFVGSIPFLKSKKKYNATVMIAPDRAPRVVYKKIHLFDVDVVGAPPSRESDIFTHGSKPNIVKVKGWKVGLSICYDLRFSELYKFYAESGVDLILVPSAFLVPTGLAHWHVLLRARAIECQAYVVAAAQCGRHVNAQGMVRETFGHSLMVGPWGEVINDAGGKGEFLMVEDLTRERLNKVRTQIPMAKHRRLKVQSVLK